VGIGGRELFYVPKCDRFMVLEPRSVRLREAAGAGNVVRVGVTTVKHGRAGFAVKRTYSAFIGNTCGCQAV
jgi:hypothetical protein